jgi:phosphatidylserine/phosphatidylglycerophosphate/cardiolipin synthase-like enzyme
MIFDKGNFYRSSCARQAPRVRELWDAGGEIRLIKPSHGGFAVMHAKTFVFDEAVLLTGSVNMTHNGLENNKEHLFRMTEPAVVAKVMSDFEQEWVTAERVTQENIDQMMDYWERKGDEKRGKSLSRTSSSGSGRPLSRSQSRELDSVAEGTAAYARKLGY